MCSHGRVARPVRFLQGLAVVAAIVIGCGSRSPLDLGWSGAGGSGGSTPTSGSTGSGPCVPVDDSSPCTDDVCEGGVPVHRPNPETEGSACDDADVCTRIDVCRTGACVGGDPVVCHGGASCVGGACVAPPCRGSIGLPGPPGGDRPVGDQYTVGYGTSGLVTSDINGDHYPDLALANPNEDGVLVLFNQGDGTFAPPVNYPVGDAPGSVLAADLNDDGRIDLAVTSTDSDTIDILIGQGDGAFAAPIGYAAGDRPVALAAGDFDGDGALDLVAANYLTTMNVLLNQGDGSFGAPAEYTSTASTGYSLSLVASDFNGDGKDDVAVAYDNYFQDYEGVGIVLNDGDGTFAAPHFLDTGYPSAIAVADLDGDGDVDLTSEGTLVFWNDGHGDFLREVTHEDGMGVVIADMNVDGVPDVALSDELDHRVTLLINEGSGDFASGIDYFAAYFPELVVAADFDSNGRPDIAFSQGGSGSVVTVLFNTCIP